MTKDNLFIRNSSPYTKIRRRVRKEKRCFCKRIRRKKEKQIALWPFFNSGMKKMIKKEYA